MATPTYAELLKGATTWKDSHKGISFLLSYHGHRDGTEYPGAEPAPGTWCYYLLIPEQMLPHRWNEFACVRNDAGWSLPGPAWDSVEFDSEITWSSSEPYFDRKLRCVFDAAKVGCDYAHLWHMERGYPDTYHSVRLDAIATVESFIKAAPDRLLCSQYSGRWNRTDRFYTAINGRLVHENDRIDPEWSGWQRPASEMAT